jgi:hypothetical protein
MEMGWLNSKSSVNLWFKTLISDCLIYCSRKITCF